MNFIVQTLPSVEGVLSPHLFSLLLPSEQVPLEPAVEVFLAFWTILEVMAIILSHYFALGLVSPVLVAPSFFSLLSCSLL